MHEFGLRADEIRFPKRDWCLSQRAFVYDLQKQPQHVSERAINCFGVLCARGRVFDSSICDLEKQPQHDPEGGTNCFGVWCARGRILRVSQTVCAIQSDSMTGINVTLNTQSQFEGLCCTFCA